MKKPDFLEVAAKALGAEPINGEVYTHEFKAATELTEAELTYIDEMTQAIFDQASKEDHRPYVLMALCGSIASNVVRQFEGELEVETVLKFIELATTSQLNHECCDGECNHDDCCGKIKENCPKNNQNEK